MSMASALRSHQQNWNRMQDNTFTAVEQRADEAAMQNQTDLRDQDLDMQKARMDDATTRRGQNFGLVGELSKPGLSGLSSLRGTPVTGDGSTWQWMPGQGAYGYGNDNTRPTEFGQGVLGKKMPGDLSLDTHGYGSSLPAGGIDAYATGGLIDGPPPPPDGSDNVDIKAKAGEYVLPPQAVELLGLDFLDRIVQMSTGHPPVHGGTPTGEGKPGFRFAGGVMNPEDAPGNAAFKALKPPERPAPPTPEELEMRRIERHSIFGPRENRELAQQPTEVQQQVAKERVAEKQDRGASLGHLSPNLGGNPTRTPDSRSRGIDKPLSMTPRSDYPNTPREGLVLMADRLGVTTNRKPPQMIMGQGQGPGDNVQATGITGKDSAGNVQQVYKNEFKPGSADYNEYGRAIYSDSKRGATKRGFDQDFAKSGNYVGDPKTGKGMPLPETVGRGGRMGLGELWPQETQAVMMGYGPARQAGLQAIRDKANLDVMRQWQGRDLTDAPQEVRDLYGKPPSGDVAIDRYLADRLSPEGQARTQAHQLGLAAIKASGKKTSGTADASAKVPGQMLDHFLKLNRDTDQGRANMALNTVMDYLPTMQQLGMSDAQMATVSTDLLNALDTVTLSKEEAKGLSDQQQMQALALKQRTEYERQLRARLGLPAQ